MNEPTERLATDVLNLLLKGDDPVLAILRRQFELCKRKPSQMSGVGFFTEFVVPDEAARVPSDASLRFGDIVADLERLQYGVGFLLFVDSGLLTMLEAFTYDEPWPETVGRYELKYSSGETRDLAGLRHTPGWLVFSE